MSKCRYAIRNLGTYDYSVLKSMISVVEIRATARWVEAGDADADVVFVGMDDAGAQHAWNSVTDAVRVWCSRAGGSGFAPTLQLPVRPDPLSRLLRRLEAELAPGTAHAEPATRSAVKRSRGSPDGYFRPADCLLGHLQDIRAGGVQALIHARHEDPTFPPPELLVDGAAQRFVWPGRHEVLTALCSMSAEGIRGRTVSDDQYHRHTVGLAEQPLVQLLWLAAVYGSAGIPMEGLTNRSRVDLKGRLSDAGIPLAPEERRLEQSLHESPRAVGELVDECGLPERQVTAFVNGCLAVGIGRIRT